jgi:hypothetical protein
MKRKNLLIGLVALSLISLISTNLLWKSTESLYKPRTSAYLMDSKGFLGAMEWKKQRTLGNEESVSADRLQEIKAGLNQVAKQKSANETEFVWTELGPDNVGGRTRALIYDRFNPTTMYVGGVSGGLWKSVTSGQSWNKVTFSGIDDSDFATLNVSCMDQGADGAIYFGTGEGFGGSMSNYGVSQGAGIWKSTDGVTFSRLESTWTGASKSVFNYVNRIACDPTNANRIYAATHKGLYYSDDAGTTFNKIPSLSIIYQTKDAKDVKISSDGTIVAAIDNRTFIAKGGDVNNMVNPSGSPIVNGGRLEFAISPNNPAYMYCQAAASTGLLHNIYMSTDTGSTWTIIGPGGIADLQTLGNQGTYDNCIAVFPDNPQKIITGGQSTMFMWSPQTEWAPITSGYVPATSPLYVHADQHVFAFHPNYGTNGNQTLVVGTDGGVHVSHYAGIYWAPLNKNLAVTQFYKIDTDGKGNVIGGTQDNGTQFNDYSGNTIRNFVEINGGDGAECRLSELNPNVTFTTVYYGSMKRSEEKGTSFYETGRFFYNNHILNKYYGGLESNIGSLSYPSAPFVTVFDLWESYYDANSIDTVIWVNEKYQIPAIEFNSFIQSIQGQFSDFDLDTVSFINQNNEKMYEIGFIIPVGARIKIGSSINQLPLDYNTSTIVNPGDTIKVQDTYQAMLAIPLYDRTKSSYQIFLTRKPLNFNVLAPYQPWAALVKDGISAGSIWSFGDLTFSKDGDHLYYSINSNLYRISGLSNARTVGQLHSDSTSTYGLTNVLIESFNNTINSIVIDPNNPDKVMVTISGYSGVGSVYYSVNGTAANPTFSNKQGNLPVMPAFTGVINWENGKQVLIGTEFGVFSTEDISIASPIWIDQNKNGMAYAFTADMVQQTVENFQEGQNYHFDITNHGMVYVGTHGRGIFRSDAWKGPAAVYAPIESTSPFTVGFSVYPNPVKDLATVEFKLLNASKVTLKVYDLSGKLVMNKALPMLQAGNHQNNLSLGHLQKGSYVLMLENGKHKSSQKIVIL